MTEQVLVVNRSDLAPYIERRTFDLIRDDLDDILDVLTTKSFFIDRPVAEKSPEYKQIIPYVVVRHDDSFFLLQRTQQQTEARLHHKLSLGVGGHINPDAPTILGGLQKELEEEVGVEGDYEVTLIGILNDDTTDVGSVHLGAVYLLDAATPDLTIRETDKMTGTWVTRAELAGKREAMETWSQVIYDHYLAR